MADVKAQSPKSTTRREKAAATRQRILDATQRLFSEYGFAGTTMQSIADEAGVAVQTVYFVFHTKGELFRELLKTIGRGSDESVETLEREWMHEAMTAVDGRRTVALIVEHGTDIFARIAPVLGAISQGSVEPDVAEAWQGIVDERREGVRQIVEVLASRGHLRDDLTADRGADIMFGLHRPESLSVFVEECGWAVEEFKAWSYRLLCDQLLELPPSIDGADSPTKGLSYG